MFKRSPNEHKKLDFETTIKLLLHAIYEELPSYRKLDGLLWINGCVKKSASLRSRIALCFVGGGNEHEYLDGNLCKSRAKGFNATPEFKNFKSSTD